MTSPIDHFPSRPLPVTGILLSALAVCLLSFTVGCVTTAPPVSEKGTQVEIGEEVPDQRFSEIGPIKVHSGNGCGGYGLRGTYEASLNLLKNRAAEMGAQYIRVQKTIEPHIDQTGFCFDNEYVIEGTAYKDDSKEWASILSGLKPMNARYRVVVSSAGVRRRPFPDSHKIKSIALGGIVQVVGQLPSGWMQVAQQGEPVGWIHSDALKLESAGSDSLSSGTPPHPSDITPPSVIITSHKVERGVQVVENRSATKITGKATDPSGVAEVKVNGQTTSLDEEGHFTADVFLKVGENEIIITAMDVRENIGRKTFTINRNPKTEMVAPAKLGDQGNFGRFYALIIGNNNYQYLPKLETAQNDAREIEKVLREKYKFETEVLLDAKRADILERINKIRGMLEARDSFLIYYAGHGEFDKTSDKAYWLPVDAKRDDDTNWILAERITSNIKRFSSAHILIVADSCYSGTMTRSLDTDMNSKAARGKYLEKMLNKSSRTLMASGGNEPVADSGGEGHSIFAQVLLNALNQIEGKLFTAEELFYNHIKESVAGHAVQTPVYSVIRDSGHDGGDFLFVRE